MPLRTVHEEEGAARGGATPTPRSSTPPTAQDVDLENELYHCSPDSCDTTDQMISSSCSSDLPQGVLNWGDLPEDEEEGALAEDLGSDAEFLSEDDVPVVSNPDQLVLNPSGQRLVPSTRVYKLPQAYVIWFDAQKKVNYQDGVTKVGTVVSVQDFWRVWNNINFKFETGSLGVFREGVQPVWEDPWNAKGGRWILTSNSVHNHKTKNHRRIEMFTDLVLGVIGGQFNSLFGEFDDAVCGCVLSISKMRQKVELWNKRANQKGLVKVDHKVREVLNMENSSDLQIDYKSHGGSLRSALKKSKSSSYTGGGPSQEMDVDGTSKGSGGKGSGKKRGGGKKGETDNGFLSRAMTVGVANPVSSPSSSSTKTLDLASSLRLESPGADEAGGVTARSSTSTTDPTRMNLDEDPAATASRGPQEEVNYELQEAQEIRLEANGLDHNSTTDTTSSSPAGELITRLDVSRETARVRAEMKVVGGAASAPSVIGAVPQLARCASSLSSVIEESEVEVLESPLSSLPESSLNSCFRGTSSGFLLDQMSQSRGDTTSLQTSPQLSISPSASIAAIPELSLQREDSVLEQKSETTITTCSPQGSPIIDADILTKSAATGVASTSIAGSRISYATALSAGANSSLGVHPSCSSSGTSSGRFVSSLTTSTGSSSSNLVLSQHVEENMKRTGAPGVVTTLPAEVSAPTLKEIETLEWKRLPVGVGALLDQLLDETDPSPSCATGLGDQESPSCTGGGSPWSPTSESGGDTARRRQVLLVSSSEDSPGSAFTVHEDMELEVEDAGSQTSTSATAKSRTGANDVGPTGIRKEDDSSPAVVVGLGPTGSAISSTASATTTTLTDKNSCAAVLAASTSVNPTIAPSSASVVSSSGGATSQAMANIPSPSTSTSKKAPLGTAGGVQHAKASFLDAVTKSLPWGAIKNREKSVSSADIELPAPIEPVVKLPQDQENK
ncbi:unnamed protein product [Amoebophrya sp. A25]|nr:unnamed protein product [Amoebophrya sp. A25]|eukprot:GSA25T00010659001.1